MKKTILLMFTAAVLAAGCKKGDKEPTEVPDVITPGQGPFLFGQTRVTDSYYVPTQWRGDSRDTGLVSYRHNKLLISGVYQVPVASQGGAVVGLEYYGTEEKGGKAPLIMRYWQTSQAFAEITGRDLNPTYTEWAQGHITYGNSTYIIGLGRYPAQRLSSYYYKINHQTQEITFHPLMQTPNGNGYAWFCGTGKGLIVAKSISVNDKSTDLEMFREDTWLHDYRLEQTGYVSMDVENIFAVDDDNLIAIVTGKKEGTGISGLFYVKININTHAMQTFKADLPEVNFHINKGAYAGGVVYMPYYENGANKCAYITLTYNQQDKTFKTKKVDLEIKNGVVFGQATLVGTKGGTVYTAGQQNGLACYWRNEKLVELENKEATRSFINDMLVVD